MFLKAQKKERSFAQGYGDLKKKLDIYNCSWLVYFIYVTS